MPHFADARSVAPSAPHSFENSGFVMLKLLFSSWGAEWGSAALVFVVSAFVGRFAAEGMNTLQWAGALVAVLGSITVAVAIRVWPNSAAQAKVRKDD
jgi:hypothetical protein